MRIHQMICALVLLALPLRVQAQEVELAEEMTPSQTSGDAFGSDKAASPMMFRTLLQVRQQQTAFATGNAQERAMTQALDGWQLQRMFVRLAARPTSWLEAKVLTDFAEPWNGNPMHVVKLAYADIDLHERVHVRVGLQKLPMSLLELLPIVVDLRPGCPPIVDQLALGACTSNAIAGAIGYLEIRDKVLDAQKACQGDVKQLCPGVKPGEGRIVNCLKQHQAELSRNCREKLGAQ